jgi:hypothetical protein
MSNRKIQIVASVVSYEEAEHNDNMYFSKLTAEELLNECFELRRLNYFGKGKLPRIEKVAKVVKKNQKNEAFF